MSELHEDDEHITDDSGTVGERPVPDPDAGPSSDAEPARPDTAPDPEPDTGPPADAEPAPPEQ